MSRHLIRAAAELALLPGSLIDRTVMRVEVPKTTAPVIEHAAPVSPAVMPKVANGKPSATPVAPRPAAPAPVPAATPRASLAYSGTTGGPSLVMPGYEESDVDAYDESIDLAVKQVLTSFRLSATEGDQAALRRGRPSIPRDVDRALLLDVSEALGMPDLSDAIRYRIRDRFWTQVDVS